MKLSIIIPVYNAEQYLENTINCILSQTFSDFELILIDDGSRDKSGLISNQWAAKDSRIVVIHQKNTGIGGARNSGLLYASGEYVGFVDNDDIIHQQMYEVMVGISERENADIVMSFEKKVPENYIAENECLDVNSVQITKCDCGSIYQNMFSNSDVDGPYMAVWNKVYRRSILEGVRFPVFGAEDVAFNSRAFLHCNLFLRIDNQINLYYWVQRKSSEWHNRFSDYQVKTLSTYLMISDELSNNCSQYAHYAIEKTFRKILSSRYTYKKTIFRAELEETVRENRKAFFSYFLKNRSISLLRKFAYLVCFYCPVFYSAFRIKQERKFEKHPSPKKPQKDMSLKKSNKHQDIKHQ